MSSANPLVRVKDPRTGAEFNASRIYAERVGLTVLDKDTHDKYGRRNAAKHNPLRSAAKPAAAKPTKSAAKAAETKES